MTGNSISKSPMLSFEGGLDGSGETRCPPVSLRAGRMELLFEPETGWIRQVRIGDREVVRAIYGAVRDGDWRTVPPVLRDVSIQQKSEEGFEIRFIAECREREIQFVWHGLISGTREGIRFEFDGAAHGNFVRNRIGLCVLHPIAELAGQCCSIEHSDGTLEWGSFPEHISPHQPFRDIRVIRYPVTNGSWIQVQFAGDTFEMEDQRNWTDASFKTYSTPLSLPFPVPVHEGDLVSQSVTLKLDPEATARPVVLEDSQRTSAGSDPCIVRVDFDRLRPKPPIGLCLNGGEAVLRSNAGRRLRALKLDHLRVDCRLWESDWQAALKLADDQAHVMGCGLHIALHLSDGAEPELRGLVQATGALQAPVRLWLVFTRYSKCTAPTLIAQVRQILMPVCPQAYIAAGTDAYFAELNRERPPGSSNWFPCCSINPQVHSFDPLSLIENLAAQTDVVNTARTFSAHPLVISPITLLPRSNPDATRAALSGNDSPADPRQSTLFAGGWTLGSLAALTSTHRVHSLTYYETVGKRGIIATGESGEVFPAYFILAGYEELRQLAEVRLTDARNSLRLAVLAGLTQTNRAVIWFANLTEESLQLRVDANPSFLSFQMKSINESNVAEARRQPEDWWSRASDDSSHAREGVIEVPRYGLARLEMIS